MVILNASNEAGIETLHRSYSSLCANEAGVPIAIMKEALVEKGRDETAKDQVMIAAQRIWRSRQSEPCTAKETVDPMSNPLQVGPPKSLVRKLFKRYDMDCSGTINSAEELGALTVNLIYQCRIAVKESEIDAKLAACNEGIEFDVARFKDWFYESFNLEAPEEDISEPPTAPASSDDDDSDDSGFSEEDFGAQDSSSSGSNIVISVFNSPISSSGGSDCELLPMKGELQIMPDPLQNLGGEEEDLGSDSRSSREQKRERQLAQCKDNTASRQASCSGGLALVVQKMLLRDSVTQWALGASITGCWVLPQDNWVRIQCQWFVSRRAFQPTVDLMTLLCTVALGVNCPLWFPSQSTGWWVFWWLDVVFAIFFTFELVARVLAHGCGQMSSGWGKLDVIVVVASWAALLEGLPDFKGGRALRTLRVLRSLRTLRAAGLGKNFGTTLSALGIAIDGVLDVAAAAGFFMLLYSAIGLSLFKGVLRQQCLEVASDLPMLRPRWCSSDLYGQTFSEDGSTCPARFYCTRALGNPNDGYASFDSIFQTMLTIFQCMTLEGWDELMRATQQAAGQQAWVFYLVLIWLFPLMTLNLFVATIRASFSKARQRELTEIAENRALQDTEFALTGQLEPSQTSDLHGGVEDGNNSAGVQKTDVACWRSVLLWEFTPWTLPRTVISWSWFDPAVIGLIVVNSVFMAMAYRTQPNWWVDMLEAVEIAFTIIFLVECTLKVFGMGGFKPYFQTPMNIFDFFLVLISLASVLVTMTGLRGIRSLRVLKMLRSLRALRMLRIMARVERLYVVFSGSGSAILTQILFIWYVMSIFGLIGMQCFQQAECDQCLGRQNFDTFGNALLTLFQVLTLESWEQILQRCAQIDAVLAIPYFVSFVLLVNWCLVEMLVAVIVEKFEISEAQREVLQRRVAMLTIEHAQNVISDANSNTTHIPELKRSNSNITHTAERITTIKMVEQQGAEDDSKMKALDLFVNEQMAEYMETKRDSVGRLVLKQWIKSFVGDKLADVFYSMRINYKVHLKGNVHQKMFVTRSLWLFEFDHPVRTWCLSVADHQAFEWSIFVVILISCFFLTLDTPNKNQQLEGIQDVIEIVDPVFVAVFLVEFIIKVVAHGFMGKPDAYITDNLNRFDFAILVVSLCALVFNELGFSGALGRLFRALRCLRPLRMVSKSQRLRVVILSTISIIPDTINVILLFNFIAFLFSTVALSLFMDGFLSCNFKTVAGKASCLGTYTGAYSFPQPAVWSLPDRNFQNIFRGMVTLLEVSSTELWTEVMFNAMDLKPEDEQPQQNADGANAIFFVVYLLLARLVIFSLIVGIIIDNFNTTSGKGMLTEKQRNFKIITQAIFIEPKPMYLQPVDRQQSPVRYTCSLMVIGMILLNGLVLVLPYYDMPEGYAHTLEAINHVLAALFVIELVIRILAYGPSQFARDAWNRFDTVVVSVMAIATFIDLVTGLSSVACFGALRVLMLGRTINRQAHSLRTILGSLVQALIPLASVLAMILLVFFVYAVLGMSYFGNVKHGKFLNYHFNFERFDMAMLMLVRMITGESWNGVMHDCMIQPPECTHGSENEGRDDCGNPAFAHLYFMSFYFIGTFFLLSLFVAVISDTFQTCNAMRSFGISQTVFDRFGQLWMETTESATPPFKWLYTHQLSKFCKELGHPLGGHDHAKSGRIYNQVAHMLGSAVTVPDGRSMIGVSYRQLLWLLVMETGDLDQIPYAERCIRTDELARMKSLVMLKRLAARWKGKQVRAAFEAHKEEARSLTRTSSSLDQFWMVVRSSSDSRNSQVRSK